MAADDCTLKIVVTVEVMSGEYFGHRPPEEIYSESLMIREGDPDFPKESDLWQGLLLPRGWARRMLEMAWAEDREDELERGG